MLNRNYRSLWIAQLLSNAGSWLFFTAVTIETARDGRAWLGGVLLAARVLPAIASRPLAAVVQHFGMVRAMAGSLWCGGATMLVLLLLPDLGLGGGWPAGGAVALVLIAGTFAAIETIARLSLAQSVVSREEISRASSLLTFGQIIARVGGGLLFLGFVALAFSLTSMLIVNCISFGLAALLVTWLPETAAGEAPSAAAGRPTPGTPPADPHSERVGRGILLTVTLLSLTLLNQQPAIAEVAEGSPDMLSGGAVLTLASLGAALGTLVVAVTSPNLQRLTIAGALALVAQLLAAGFATRYAFPGLVLLAALSAAWLVAGAYSLLGELSSGPEERVRWVSLFSMAFVGIGSLGAISSGVLSDFVGGEATLALHAAVGLLGMLWLAAGSRLAAREMVSP